MNENSQIVKDNNQITKKDLNRVFWRMQILNITNNFQSMQAIGFLSSFTPILERLYKDKPKELRTKAMKRHLEFYNSHVNSGALILGVSAALEESTDEDQKDTVTAVKTGLMGPLAGVGDSLLKFTWLPICGSIGATLALNGSVLGPILMFLMYNTVNLLTKYYGIHLGYSKGIELVEDSENNILQRVANIANVVGLMVVGALIAGVVKVNVIGEIAAGDNIIMIQEMLDKVMPQTLSLLTVLIVYRLLKKSDGKIATKLIFSIMIISIILVSLGVL